MKLNFYSLLILILSLSFCGAAFAQLSHADTYFPSAVGNTWIYNTPRGPLTMKITKDSLDSHKNKYIFYNSDNSPMYKIDSAGENIYYIYNGLNQVKYQISSDSGGAWIEDSDSPVTVAKVNGVFPYYIFGKPRDVKQFGYYTVPGDTSLADDFSDGDDSGWTVNSGSFSVDNSVPNPLSANQYSLVCSEAGIIGIPCSQAYGTWQFDIYKGAGENNLEVDFIADSIGNAMNQNGYYISNSSSGAVNLARSSIGSSSVIMSSADNYTVKEGTWYQVTITRNSNGEFYTYIEGGGFTSRTLISVIGGYGTNPTIDTGFAISKYFVLDIQAGDRISNIICYYTNDLNLTKDERIISPINSNFEDSLDTWFTIGNHNIERVSINKHGGKYGGMIINKNLSPNQSFELNTIGWDLPNGPGATTKRDTNVGYNGISSIKVAFDGTTDVNYAMISKSFAIQQNTVYDYKAYIKADSISGNGRGMVLEVQWKQSDGTSISYNSTPSMEGTYDWTLFNLPLISPSIAGLVNIRYRRIAGTGIISGTAWFDNNIFYQKGNSFDNYVILSASSFTSLVPGNKYIYEMWYKSPYLNGDTVSVNIGDQTKTFASSDTWTKLSWTFQADDSTINRPIKIFLNQADTLYIDDVSLKPASTLLDKAVYDSEIWLADGIGEYYEYSAKNGALRTLKSCVINGDTLVTSVQDDKAAALNSFKLYQNYPNPFNPVTNINYNIPVRGKVVINVYDILGREVVSLVNENQEPGFHSVKFNAGNFPSGVYIYRITVGEFSESRKLVLLK